MYFLVSLQNITAKFCFLQSILKPDIVARITSWSHQGPSQTEFHYDRLHQIARITPHFREFFLGELFWRKSPPNITGEVIFKKSYLLSRVIFCWLKVSSTSRKVKAINKQKVLANVKFQASSLPTEMIWENKNSVAWADVFYFCSCTINLL